MIILTHQLEAAVPSLPDKSRALVEVTLPVVAEHLPKYQGASLTSTGSTFPFTPFRTMLSQAVRGEIDGIGEERNDSPRSRVVNDDEVSTPRGRTRP